MLSDRRMTVQMIADELQIGKTSIYSILSEDLEMRKVCAKIVPKLLTPEQKLRRKQRCIDWKALEERDAFLERVITDGDDDYSRIDNVAQRLEGRRLSRVLQPMETEVGQVQCV
jgi:hypothetical protein